MAVSGLASTLFFFVAFATASVHSKNRLALAKGDDTSTTINIIEVRGERGEGGGNDSITLRD